MSEPDPNVSRLHGPVIRTQDLFGARREVIIKHGDKEYRLRITKTDKLILTK
jgi:hemin uptake protein HemP